MHRVVEEADWESVPEALAGGISRVQLDDCNRILNFLSAPHVTVVIACHTQHLFAVSSLKAKKIFTLNG